MIFITVGSQKFPFDRILQTMDRLVAAGIVQDSVFAQSGASTYIPVNYPSKAFLDREEFREKMNASDIVVTHGGTGAIIGAVKARKKVIAVPRLKKYGEHVDDHQLQLIAEFEKTNLICSCLELDELGQIIEEVRSKEFAAYQSHTSRYLEDISSYIESL